MSTGFTGAPALRSTSDSRSSPPRTWVADPPPFGVAQDRFQQPARTGSPDYHVAYRDVQQPPRWNAKGWVGMDDHIKPRRGTAPSVYGSPGLIPPSAPPRHAAGLAPLAAPHPNEVRLQELLNLQRRKLETDPGPGAYEPRDINHRRRFRRQANPDTDGPFFLDEMPDGTSTRVKEIAETLRQRADSGLGPGEYDGAMNKDVLMKSTPAPKLGTSARSGKTDHAKSLSISRSIQHGIDWHVPVIVQPIVVPPIGSTSASGAGGGGGGGGGTSASGGAEPSTSGRPLTADRSNALYGGTSSAGGTSRDTSPTGRGGTADQYLGVPPPPPAHVSRGVKKQQQRRPGDWDWNRLPKNYRNSWTTLHGGAYTHGEHPLPRPGSREAAMAAAAGMLGSGPAAPGSGHPPYPYPYQAMDVGPSGIYPIQEESSSALERDESSSYGAAYPHGTQPHSVQSVTSANAAAAGLTAQLKQVAYWGGEGPGGGGGGGGGGEGQGGGGGGASQSQGPGLPSGLVPSPKLRALVSDEDVRRRRAAAAFAARAQLQANRVGDWQSKFAG